MHALGAVIVALVAVGAHAQSPAVVPPNVEAVVSGGVWNAKELKGTYRAVVLTGGFEHVSSQLQIDWIADTEGNDKPSRVIASKVAETGSWRLGKPQIVKSANGWRVRVQGVEPHQTPQVRGIWVVELGPPGSLKAILHPR